MTEFTSPIPDWDALSPASLLTPPKLFDECTLCLNTQYGELFLNIGEQGLRIRTTLSDQDNFSILKTHPSAQVLNIQQQTTETTVEAGGYQLILSHKPLAFVLSKDKEIVQQSATDGHFVRRHRLPPFAKTSKGWMINLELDYDEAVYGLGEKWSKLDKRGQLIRSYNHDALGVNAEKSYKNTPYAWSVKGWHVFAHTPAPVTHSVGYAPWSQRAYSIVIEDPKLDFFLYHANTPAQGLQCYATMTGFAPVPPHWSVGTILSKAYYRDAQELLATAREVRTRNMPCDVITLDGRAWQDTQTRFAFEWDSSRYANPKPILDELKAMNFKICIWEYPMISVNNALFAEAAAKGWLIKDKRTGEAWRYQWDLSPFGEVLTPLPESGIVDFTHPEAFEFWMESHKALFDLGIDMIKADFGEQLEDDNMLSYSGDSGMRLHNVYSLLYNRCVYQAAQKYAKNGAFIFSRSAWAGSQCYPAQWGGDPQADWQGLAASIRGALSWGMSGGPFYATDVGGFYKDTRDAKLYVRWLQASVFSAHLRLHGIGQREPWSYTDEACDAAFEALRLRYQLLPYLRVALKRASQTGLPVQRAMPLAFPNEPLCHAFEHQFMCGDDLLVVPCLNANDKVKFYLPEGAWYFFPSNRRIEGGRYYEQTLSLKQIAVFVRQGTRLHLSEGATHTNAEDNTIVWEAG